MISVFLINIKNKETKDIPKVSVKEPISNNQFALMIEQTKGEHDYQESNDELPTEGYKFNKEKSKCIDVNGQEIKDVLDYNYDDYIVLLDTSKTAYCYLYYDIYEKTMTPLELVASKPQYLSESLVGDMHRYQGLYTDEINNYICLGDYCCNTQECGNDDTDAMYRIIGITDSGEMKVIKKTALSYPSVWWSDDRVDTKWPQSSEYQKLNGKSEGSTEPNLEDKNSYYYSLDGKLKELIINNHSWLYGDVVDPDNLDFGDFNYNGDAIYGIESGKREASYYTLEDYPNLGKSEWKERIEAPLGLMYISDYYYAYKTNENDSGNPGSANNAVNSWIHLLNNGSYGIYEDFEIESTMSRYSYLSIGIIGRWFIYDNGCLAHDNLVNPVSIRPTFYLTSSIELTGKGTLTEPFRITSLEE